MKTYKLQLNFIEGNYIYTFKETTLKNPNNEILFCGTATKKIKTIPRHKRPARSMYVLHYTENTLKRLNAELITS